jgi:hypothetical protein
MPDADDELTPATRGDIETCLSLGRTRGSSLARRQAAEVTAKVVAERLVAHLERSGFVVMRKPILFDTLLLASVTTKPAVMGMAGFVPDWIGCSSASLTALSVPRAGLLINGRSFQQLVMQPPRHPRCEGVRGRSVPRARATAT